MPPVTQAFAVSNMALFLKHTFEATFDLDPVEFKEKLSSHVMKPTLSKALKLKKEKSFFGEINDEYFKIWRITSKRKGSLPNIKGQIKPYLGGVKVIIQMEPDHETFTFVIAWTIGTLGLGIVSAIYHEIFQNTAIYCFLLFVFGIFLTYQYFWAEVPKSKNIFFDIFKG